ncbi:MAG: hypothetical protein IKK08_00550 [Clostridia bacterium]|nr:hypothetical protein [Clostridia bacterium]
MKKKILLLCVLLCFSLLLPSAQATDGIFTLNVDGLDMSRLNQNDYVQQYLSAPAQGLEVVKQIPQGETQPVRLSLTQMDTQLLVFDKDYGLQTGLFSSGTVYLPYVGNYGVPYLVTLYVGDMVYAMPFLQQQSRLRSNGACTYGVHLYDYDPALGQDWYMGTMLDLNALRTQGVMAVDVCASNCYLIGQANIILQDQMICVILNLNPAAGVEVHSQEVYVAADCARLVQDGWGEPSQPGEWIHVGDADSVMLYLPMSVSYDPVGLSGFGYDLTYGYLQQQLALWRQNCGLE